MTKKYKPLRRSLLFCPAINERYIEKAINTSADSIIYDLEDSVDNSKKYEARTNLLKLFPKKHSAKKELMIRINNERTSFYKKDLELIKKLKPDVVCYPKAESKKEIKDLDYFIKSNKLKTKIFVLIETCNGFFNAKDILTASKNITATALGVEDLISELGIERGNLKDNNIINYVLINLILLSTSLKIQNIGPIYRGYGTTEHNDELLSECKYLREMNVRGKLAINPRQLDIINKEFSISKEKLLEAKNKIKQFRLAKLKGSIVISHDHEMEDTPSLKKARDFIKYSFERGFGLPTSS